MQVIVCDDDIENLNEMIKVCRDVMVKGTEVRGFSDARMLAESLQAHTVQPALMLLDIDAGAFRVGAARANGFEAAYDRYYLCNVA